MKFHIFRPIPPINSQSSNSTQMTIHITINPTDVYIRCKNTKNAKHDKSIGSKRIKYMFLVFLKKLDETDMLQVILT